MENFYFERLFTYNGWANQAMAQGIEYHALQQDNDFLGLFYHIAAAEAVWYNRVAGQQPPVDLFESRPYELALEMQREYREKWIELAQDLSYDRLMLPIVYHNSKGEQYRTPLVDILAHVVNHGTYHRAQLAQNFRQRGFQPPATDYIAFARQFGLEH